MPFRRRGRRGDWEGEVALQDGLQRRVDPGCERRRTFVVCGKLRHVSVLPKHRHGLTEMELRDGGASVGGLPGPFPR